MKLIFLLKKAVEPKAENKAAGDKPATVAKAKVNEEKVTPETPLMESVEEKPTPKVLTKKAKEQLEEALENTNPIASPGERMRIEEDLRPEDISGQED